MTFGAEIISLEILSCREKGHSTGELPSEENTGEELSPAERLYV